LIFFLIFFTFSVLFKTFLVVLVYVLD